MQVRAREPGDLTRAQAGVGAQQDHHRFLRMGMGEELREVVRRVGFAFLSTGDRIPAGPHIGEGNGVRRARPAEGGIQAAGRGQADADR